MRAEHCTCPVCWREVPSDLIAPSEAIGESIKPLLTVNSRGWEPGKGLCGDCLSRLLRVHERLAKAFPEFAEQELKIIPTPMRLDAPERYRGRGVAIAFIDAGFYAHPDLSRPRNRIARYVSVTDRARPSDLAAPKPSSWHGMMTSVVAAGNGFLSGGLYRGIASEADLVLVKAGTASRIRHGDIEAALRWVVRRRERYNIRSYFGWLYALLSKETARRDIARYFTAPPIGGLVEAL
jgi:serine protease AprX